MVARKKPGAKVTALPGKPARRSRRASPDSGELLDKAFELFVERGFEGTSLDAISAVAGVAKRTLYQRYGDKEGLFRAAVAHGIQQWMVPIERYREAESEDLAVTLRTIGRMFLDNVLSPMGLSLQRLTNSVSPRMPELGAHNVEKGVNPTLDFITDLVRRRLGDRLDDFLTPEDVSMAFMNMVVTGPATFVSQGVALDGKFLDHYVDACVSLLLRGLLPDAGKPVVKADEGGSALLAENEQLKMLLAERMVEGGALRQLEEENAKLKLLVADLSLEKAMLQETLSQRQ